MSTETKPDLPPGLLRRLEVEATSRGRSLDQLTAELVESALDHDEVAEYCGGSGDHMLALLHHAPQIAITYPAEHDGDGGTDATLQSAEVAEVEQLGKQAGLSLRAVPREFEIGRGAQGDPWTWIELAQNVTTIFGAIASPALAIVAWRKFANDMRAWLVKRRGRAGIGFVKLCCLHDAQTRVEDPTGLVHDLVAGHGGAAFFGEYAETIAVGPYCVTVQVPEKSETFVYVTDQVGEILHFHAVPAEEVGDIDVLG